MKALRRNPANLLVVALVSVGAVSLGLLGLAGFDVISVPFGALTVWSRGASSVVGLAILYRWMTQKNLQREYVRVRV